MGVIQLPTRFDEPSRRRFVLVSSCLSETNEALLAAARARFRDTALISGDELAHCVRPDDAVLARLDVRPSLDGIEPGLIDLQELEHARRPPWIFNPAGALFTCHDKLATAITFGAAGLPHPRTACVDHPSQLTSLAPPVVVKPRLGRSGADVFVCDSRRELRRCFRSIAKRTWFQRQGALVQAFVPASGPELRIPVAAGAAIGVQVPRIAAELAVRAAQTVRADLVEVDLIPVSPGNWIALELNAASEITTNDEPGLESLCALIVGRLAARMGSQDLLRHRFAGRPTGTPVHLS